MSRLSFLEHHPLSPYTTLGMGGTARYFCQVESIEEAEEALQFALEKGIQWRVLGKGSNVLLSKAPFLGLYILNKISFCHIDGHHVKVGGGYSFARLGTKLAMKGLGGLEFAAGIPASVGGAIVMNAGANGQETCDTLQFVEFLDGEGKRCLLEKDNIEFSYRFSSFQRMDVLITSASFSLYPCEEAKQKQRQLLEYRLSTQPYKAKTAGCMFRNPKNQSAGALIEECGLKGFQQGRVRVSNMHANFIENLGGATSDEVASLVEHIQQVVYEKKKIQLQLEVKFLD